MADKKSKWNQSAVSAKYTLYNDKCDKYDYLIAVACGAVAGLVDAFLVGAPTDSRLLSWSDAQVDNLVKAFARKSGWSPREGNETSIAGAIGFLERKFSVNYDQRYSSDVTGMFDMAAKNHHLKSLAHSTDVVGLFFSVVNQFTSTSSFISGGEIITVSTETFELQGGDYISKLYCGVANWFGHIMSDAAGSSGSGGRGTGVAMPFYEMFLACNWGSFQVSESKITLANIATKAFQEGYDLRAGLSMSIPVILCDILIKLLWAIKHYFYNKRPLTECIPSKRHADLRMMLLIGNGTLCLIDGVDAAVRAGGNWLTFFMRINFIAWLRLAHLSLREICIRVGISFPLQKQLDAFIMINEVLDEYLSRLKQIDIERFRRETAQYNCLLELMEASDSEDSLNELLIIKYRELGFELPYEGDFEDFMADKNAVLKYK